MPPYSLNPILHNQTKIETLAISNISTIEQEFGNSSQIDSPRDETIGANNDGGESGNNNDVVEGGNDTDGLVCQI